MYEKIKERMSLVSTPMDIIKAFQANETTMHITIRGTHEEPLFRASDIGEVLEITHIRTSIQDFDSSEKNGVRIMDIMGRKQETTFLTEKGLYKLLFKSRKPIAKQFTDWVCEVIKEIRLNGRYQLEQKIEDFSKEIIPQKFLKCFYKNKLVSNKWVIIKHIKCNLLNEHFKNRCHARMT